MFDCLHEKLKQRYMKLQDLMAGKSVGHSAGFAGALQTLGGSQRSASLSVCLVCLNKI